MSELHSPSSEALRGTIEACKRNAERLLDETFDLEFREPTSTRFFLAMIAQEELAKAFIFYLIRERVIPFSRAVLRAVNDHACKQLVGVIMDYTIMHWDEIDELKALVERDAELGDRLPPEVGSAMDFLRYEKIGRWERSYGIWAEDPGYDKLVLRIADGRKDGHKQDALYVRVGRDGRVCSTPESAIVATETRAELERAHRYRRYVESLLAEGQRTDRHEKAVTVLKLLFVQAS
jgi:hypothetical protein